MKSLISIILLSVVLRAQSSTASPAALDDAPQQHLFWTIEKKVDVGILAGLAAADAITTQRGLNQGLREANPAMRPFVTRGAPGQAVGSALGFGAGVGVVYLLHRSHHYKMERIAGRLMIAGEAATVANNIVAIRQETEERRELSFARPNRRRNQAALNSQEKIERVFKVEVKDQSHIVVADVEKLVHVRRKKPLSG